LKVSAGTRTPRRTAQRGIPGVVGDSSLAVSAAHFSRGIGPFGAGEPKFQLIVSTTVPGGRSTAMAALARARSVMVAVHLGVLGVALHRDFSADPGVHVCWSCRSAAPLDADALFPQEEACSVEAAAMTGLSTRTTCCGCACSATGSTASSGRARHSASIAT
jgi:hypothetical protein